MRDVLLTAIAPVIWGTTYFVATEFLPSNRPLTTAALRALPVGLLLLIVFRLAVYRRVSVAGRRGGGRRRDSAVGRGFFSVFSARRKFNLLKISAAALVSGACL